MTTPTSGKLPILPTNLTAAEYEGIFAGAGTYEGNDPSLHGKSWGDAYAALWAANVKKGKKYSPYKVALYIEELMFIQGDIGALVTALGNFAEVTNNSIATFHPGLSNPLEALGQLAGVLTSKALWVRVGEFTVGGLLLYVGLKALATPQGQSVANHSFKDTAKKAGKLLVL